MNNVVDDRDEKLRQKHLNKERKPLSKERQESPVHSAISKIPCHSSRVREKTDKFIGIHGESLVHASIRQAGKSNVSRSQTGKNITTSSVSPPKKLMQKSPQKKNILPITTIDCVRARNSSSKA